MVKGEKMSGTAATAEGDEKSAYINLKVIGQNRSKMFFKIKRSAKLQKLMTSYSHRKSLKFDTIAFLLDGRRITGGQTPDELEMKDDDEIDAMLHTTGGGCGGC